MKTRLTIGAAGRVTSIKITRNQTGDPALATCITSKIKSWRFPAPQGGSVTFSYAWTLSTQ